MTITEKVAYLKGLAQGLEIDEDSKEGKMFSAIIDVLDEVALSISDLDDVTEGLCEEVDDIYEELDEIDEDLGALEDDFYGDEEDEDDDDIEEDMYEVTCPSCGEKIYIDEGVLDEGKIACPACGEDLELDVSLLEDDFGGCTGDCCTCGECGEDE